MSPRKNPPRNKGKGIITEASGSQSKKRRMELVDEPDEFVEEPMDAADKYHAEKFRKKVDGLGLGWEKSLHIDTKKLTATESIWKYKRSKRWERFVGREIFAYEDMVKEFYYNLHFQRNNPTGRVRVRGTEVPLDIQTINTVLGFRDFPNPRCPFGDMTSEDVENIDWKSVELAILRDGEKFFEDKQGNSKVRFAQVKPEWRLWLHFVVHNFFGSTSVKEVGEEVIYLIYLIATGVEWDMGKWIYKKLQYTRGPGNLVLSIRFPVTVTQLCLHAGVPLKEGELKKLPQEARQFSTQSVKAITGGKLVKGESSSTAPPSGGRAPPNDELTEHLNRIEFNQGELNERFDTLQAQVTSDVQSLRGDFERFSLNMYDMMEAQMRASGVDIPPRHP